MRDVGGHRWRAGFCERRLAEESYGGDFGRWIGDRRLAKRGAGLCAVEDLQGWTFVCSHGCWDGGLLEIRNGRGDLEGAARRGFLCLASDGRRSDLRFECRWEIVRF